MGGDIPGCTKRGPDDWLPCIISPIMNSDLDMILDVFSAHVVGEGQPSRGQAWLVARQAYLQAATATQAAGAASRR
jgi:hypothetical protein